MQSSAVTNIIIGNIIHSKSLTELEIIHNAAIGISTDGTIAFILRTFDESALKRLSPHIHKLSPNEFLIPGFVDTHCHAPQYYFLGLGTDLPLLQWLEKYVFPCESRFDDPTLAKKVFSAVVNRSLRNGTTTLCLFGTIQLSACKILADVVEEIGTRAFIGKINMDQNSPSFYIEKPEDSLRATREFIEYVQAKKLPDKIVPVVTPRFAPTCSMPLMTELGKIAKEYNVPIQSHVAENKGECEWVLKLFPGCKNYTDVYEQAGLLTDKTIMAHCIHLTESELDVMKKYGVGMAHCPNSNFNLMSGVMPFKAYSEKGMKVGLGTDISGGWSLSMLDSMRYAITASKVCVINDAKMKQMSVAEAFYLATVGGAKVLGLDDKVGNFEVGKQFDAQVVSIGAGNIDMFGYESLEEKLAKFVYGGDDRNVKEVYVKGLKVYAAGEVATAPSSPLDAVGVKVSSAPSLDLIEGLEPQKMD